jgi:hypothetical protein
MYELTRRYDEFKIKNPDMDANSILPQLVLSKRSNTDLIKRNSYEELRNLTEKCKRKFINMISDNESGFYNYRNEKGEQVCDGYDNFGALLKTNSNCLRKNPLMTSQRSSQYSFENPFDGSLSNFPQKSTSMDLSNLLNESNNNNMNTNNNNSKNNLASSRNLLMDQMESINYEQCTQGLVNESSLVSSNQKFNSNTSLNSISTSDYNNVYTNRLKDDDEKDCLDTFKAQNIRSLTFKTITTY